VAEALSTAFAGCGDAVLSDLQVVSVVPAPNAGRLLVTVAASPSGAERDAAVVQEHLRRGAGLLRTEVAAAIHRRKMPELTYQVPVTEPTDHSN
jgi:ribosome-binding factor A